MNRQDAKDAKGFDFSLCISLLAAILSAVALAGDAKRAEPNKGGAIDLSSQDPQVALQCFKLLDGYKIELFASEKDFPELANPLAMTFDAKGRLWVTTMPSYPQYHPPHKPNDKIVILEDADGNGKADKCSVFADGLHLPTGVELGLGGAYVASQPDLLFLKDTDGDSKADVREAILHGLGSEDSHHAVHAFVWGPDGGLYFHEGTFHASQVETPYGPLRLSNAGAFRFEPRTWRTSVFVSYPFSNPWGQVFDRWGQNFIADASSGFNYFASPISGHVDYPDKHSMLNTFIKFSVRPTCGCLFVASRHFPEAIQGRFLFNNCIGFQGIKQYTVQEDGAGFSGEMIEDFLVSSDPNFRPVALRFAPDGSLFIVDWFNPLIGHMQYSLRDERRDHIHGRIWRVTYPGRPLVRPPLIAGAPLPAVLDALKEYEDDARYRARRELNERNRDEVVAALKEWLAKLDPNDKEYEHHLLEGLWIYQTVNVVNDDARALLNRLLNAKEPRARAAATRALRYWLDRVNDPLAVLRKQMRDEFPRVRMEALLTLSFFKNPEAAEVALQALDSPTDYWIEYVLGETMRALGPRWKPALAAGKPFCADNPEGLDYALQQISVAELAGAARSKPVYQALLVREGVGAKERREALAGLAKLNGTSEFAELAAALGGAKGGALADLAELVAQWDAAALRGARELVRKLAKESDPSARRAGLAAMMRADGSAAQTWAMAERSGGWLDLLESVALIREPKLLEDIYPRILPLLKGAPSVPAAKKKKNDSNPVIRRAAIGALAHIPGHDAEIFGALAEFVLKDIEADSAISALSKRKREVWPKENFGALAQAVAAHAAKVSAERRDTPEFAAALDLGRFLAGGAPKEAGDEVRGKLREIEVQSFTIRAIAEQMRYDISQFYVEAGRTVLIKFENPDIMQHNLLIVEPGAMAEVGQAAEALGGGGFAKNFVPDSPKVLFKTKLVMPQSSERLLFTAPAKPSDYPYLCTFPGHWIIMNGTMTVVGKDDPKAGTIVRAQTGEKLPPPAELAKLAGDAASGKALFEKTCLVCHKIGERGSAFGPELTQVGGRLAREKLFESILQPDAMIDPKFQNVAIKTDNGAIVTGIVAGEDDGNVRLKIGGETIQTIKRSSIMKRNVLKTSAMPAGLEATMTKQQVVDLVEYLSQQK